MEPVTAMRLGVLLLIAAAGFAAVCLSYPARAAVITEEGPNYHVIEYDAGGGEAGSVTLKIEIVVGTSSSTFAVKTTIVSVDPAPQWTYSVRKNGGVNAAVQVEFASAYGCSTTFKANYAPGKTVVDGGKVKRR